MKEPPDADRHPDRERADMLIDPENLRAPDPVLSMIAGSGDRPIRLAAGQYEIGHFSFDMLLSARGGNLTDDDPWTDYPEFPVDDGAGIVIPDCYGVCDSSSQFMEDHGAWFNDADRKFCISFTPVHKSEQGSDGGWRWHKWGVYIGRGIPTHEHLYYESDFETVYCFHIYERTD